MMAIDTNIYLPIELPQYRQSSGQTKWKSATKMRANGWSDFPNILWIIQKKKWQIINLR
jgi:hypothetical protein